MRTIRSVIFVEGRIANKNGNPEVAIFAERRRIYYDTIKRKFNLINQVSLEDWLYGISSYIDFILRYWFSISLLNTLCNEIDAISGRRVFKR